MSPTTLIGRQVAAVVNFPPRQIGKIDVGGARRSAFRTRKARSC